MKIENRIKDLRIKNNLSFEEFAAIGAVSERSQRMYENGKTTPSIEYCAAIATFFKINMDWLLTGEGDTYKRTGLNPVSVTDKNGVVNVVNESEGANDSITPAKVELLKLLDRITEVDPAALQGFIYDAKKHIENCEMRNELAQMRQMISQQQMAA